MSRWLAIWVLGVVMLGAAEAKPPPNYQPVKPANPEARQIYAEGNKLVKLADNLSLSALVGKSPWLIMASGGAYRYFTTPMEEREQLSYFAQPWFWATIWVLILLVALKDTLLSWAGWLKVPLNALAELFHTSGGLVGYLFLGGIALDGLSGTPEAAVNLAATTTAPATLPSSEAAFSLVNFVLMSLVHTAVWIVFNTVEVAIILSPFPFVDLVLKSGLPPPLDVSLTTSVKQFLRQCWQWLTGSGQPAARPETAPRLS